MSPSNRKRRLITILFLFLVLVAGYGVYRMVCTPPALTKVRQLQRELAAADARGWSTEQHQAKLHELRVTIQQLSSAQRATLAAERQQQLQADMERYSRMSPPEKIRYLDEQIDRAARIRQQWTGTNGGPPFSSTMGTNTNRRQSAGSSSATPDARDQRRKEMLDRTTPEYRALRDQFRKDLENRRKQRGLVR